MQDNNRGYCYKLNKDWIFRRDSSTRLIYLKEQNLTSGIADKLDVSVFNNFKKQFQQVNNLRAFFSLLLDNRTEDNALSEILRSKTISIS